MRRAAMIGGVVSLVAACAGGIRPGYEPFPQAVGDTVRALPPAVVQALASAIVSEGLRIQWQSATEGYVETQWYDLVNRQNGSFDRSAIERFVRLKFYVDPVGTDQAAIFGEALSLRTTDPSVMPREAEMMLPAGHAGRVVLDRVMRTAMTNLGTR